MLDGMSSIYQKLEELEKLRPVVFLAVDNNQRLALQDVPKENARLSCLSCTDR